MSVATVSTRRITGLDYRIWLVMSLCWVACAGWFVYETINTTKAQYCSTTFHIIVNGEGGNGIAVCDLDATAFFQIDAPPDAKVEWNFDDGSKIIGDNRAGHKFKAEDNYTVVATVNGRCETKKDVTVKKAVAVDAVKPSVKIFADTGRTVGSRIRFSAVANVPISSYQWALLPTNETQTGANAAFDFPRAGEFTVQVTINNDPTTRQEQPITITDLPLPAPVNPNPFPGAGGASGGGSGVIPPPLFPSGDAANSGTKTPNTNAGANNGAGSTTEPAKTEQAKPKATVIDPDGFKSLLQEVLDGSKELTDLYPFLDYTGSTKVVVNGKDEMKITDFVREKRKKKIEALDFQKDDKNGIQKIKVKLRHGLWPFSN